jgi:hypothetical protein
VSTPAASSVFALHARDYDAYRRRLVPEFDAFYAAVRSQLRWLADAGFETVDCVNKSRRFAVLGAWKAQT